MIPGGGVLQKITRKQRNPRPAERAQHVKAVSPKPEDLSLISIIHLVKRTDSH